MDKKRKLLMPAGWLAIVALLMMAVLAPAAQATGDNHDGWHWDGHWHWECERGTPPSGPSTVDHGTGVTGWDWEHDWDKDCWQPSPDPCATAAPVHGDQVGDDHHDVVCPTPVPTPEPTVEPTPIPTPTEAPSASVSLPSGDVGGETGNPNITPPPTDEGSAVAAVARSWTTLLLAVAGLLASLLVLTPMAIRRRR